MPNRLPHRNSFGVATSRDTFLFVDSVRGRLFVVRERIESLFQDVLGPLFALEGGSIELVDVRDKLVLVRVGGAYRGCPSTQHMLEGVVVPALRAALGTAVKVELVVL